MASQSSTLDEQELSSSSSGVERTPAITLVVVGCPDEPWRVGDVALLASPESAEARLLGRGSSQPDDPCPRLSFARMTAGAIEVALPLGLPRISRAQAFVRRVGDGAIEVRNVGRSELLHDDEPVDVALVRPGETLQFGRQLLLLCVSRAAGMRATEGVYATERFGEADRHGIVGESDAVWTLRRRISFVAGRAGHVLIHGSSGTGKELIASAIHALSNRRDRPMVSRNAATIPDGIVDAELFGNVRNYPNQGVPERPGLIGQANGSTLFLDEFAELPPAVQPHLLRVLDGGDYQRLGEATARRSDLRLIAATNRPIEVIKEDLRARFMFLIELPQLNDRRDDIPLLVRHLLRKFARQDASVARRIFPSGNWEQEPNVSLAMLRALVTHTYRTHMRELEGLLWRAIETSRGSELDLAGLPDIVGKVDSNGGPTEGASPQRSGGPPDATASDALTREKIQATLDEHNGKVELAWRALGLTNRYVLRRLIAKYGIEVRRRPKRPR